jgi:hypothetical protein
MTREVPINDGKSKENPYRHHHIDWSEAGEVGGLTVVLLGQDLRLSADRFQGREAYVSIYVRHIDMPLGSIRQFALPRQPFGEGQPHSLHFNTTERIQMSDKAKTCVDLCRLLP